MRRLATDTGPKSRSGTPAHEDLLAFAGPDEELGFGAGEVHGVAIVRDDGEVVTLAAADTFKVLGRSSLGESTRATPAVAGGRMFLRTESHIIAVGKNPVAAGKNPVAVGKQ